MNRVTIEHLMAETGAGPNTTRRLVREGKLPGFIDGTTYICSAGEFEKWLKGEWTYTGVQSTPPKGKKRKPLAIVRNERAA